MQFFIRCDKEHSSEKDPARQNFKICIQTLTLTSLLLRDMASWVPLPDQQWVVIGVTPKEEMLVIVTGSVRGLWSVYTNLKVCLISQVPDERWVEAENFAD